MQQKVAYKAKTCPQCKTKLSDFAETGYLGCSFCYRAFAEEIFDMLPTVQTRTQNRGKQYGGSLPDKDLISIQIAQMRDTAAKEKRYQDAEILDRQLALLNDID